MEITNAWSMNTRKLVALLTGGGPTFQRRGNKMVLFDNITMYDTIQIMT